MRFSISAIASVLENYLEFRDVSENSVKRSPTSQNSSSTHLGE